jgi:hypothetical protein
MSQDVSSLGAVMRAEARGLVQIEPLDCLENATPPLWLQRASERLHRRGPRACGELLNELILEGGPAFAVFLRRRLEAYGRLDPDILKALGGWRFPGPPLYLVRR